MFSPSFFLSVRLAFRARYAGLVSGTLFFVLAAAFLSSLFSGRQPATVALDVGLSALRLALPFLVAILTQDLLHREFERRYFLNSLAYPGSRVDFLIGRVLSIVGLAFLALLLAAGALGVMVSVVSAGYQQGTSVALGLPYLVTLLFLLMDTLVLCLVAVLLAVVASTPSFVLIGTLGFMLIARSYSAVIELLLRETYVVDDSEGYGAGLGVLGYLFPDLGSLDVRMIALYGNWGFLPENWLLQLVICASYVCFIFFLTVFFLCRKRFS